MIYDLIYQAYISAVRNRVRSLLTIFALAVGVAVLGASLMTAIGASRGVWSELEKLTENIIEISWMYTERSQTYLKQPPKDLNDADVQSIAELKDIKSVYPIIIRVRVKIKYSRLEFSSRMEAIPQIQEKSSHFEVIRGRYFTPLEQEGLSSACYIAQDLAQRMFPGKDMLGEILYVNGLPTKIVGILPHKVDIFRRNFNNRLVVPMPIGYKIIGGIPLSYDYIFAAAEPGSDLSYLARQVDKILRNNHGVRNYRVSIPEDMLNKKRQILYAIVGILITFAFFCLFVSGIGIMNVLLFSIKERKQEIGVRLSLGATPMYIRLLISTEALLISLVGGVIGGVCAYPLSMVMTYAVYSFIQVSTELRPDFSMTALVAAVVFSGLTGLASAIYPAYFASRLEPSECFRK